MCGTWILIWRLLRRIWKHILCGSHERFWGSITPGALYKCSATTTTILAAILENLQLMLWISTYSYFTTVTLYESTPYSSLYLKGELRYIRFWISAAMLAAILEFFSTNLQIPDYICDTPVKFSWNICNSSEVITISFWGSKNPRMTFVDFVRIWSTGVNACSAFGRSPRWQSWIGCFSYIANTLLNICFIRRKKELLGCPDDLWKNCVAWQIMNKLFALHCKHHRCSERSKRSLWFLKRMRSFTFF